jgi:Choline/Carnitine o-acyltransferase
MPSVYESCSMRHFRDGRTETIRPVTLESRAFVEAYESPSTSMADKKSALVKSIAAHSKRSRDAQLGVGTDRHMFALAVSAVFPQLRVHVS